MNSNAPFKVAAMYRFTPLEDLALIRAQVYAVMADVAPSMCGTLLLAPEGINGTIAAYPEEMDAAITGLNAMFGIQSQGAACELKFSRASEKPFNRFKVRLKKELITLRKPEADPMQQVGEYVEPKDWNALISDPEVLLVDTRNDYETKVGIFEGAIDPNMQEFTEFPGWVEENLDPAKHKKVAMFCTGGIRCEKASSYMLAQGFEHVYHLKGGILDYLENIPAEESKWDGECFVFDQRVAVGHGLAEGSWHVCHACREPLSAEDIQRPEYEKGISCHHCHDSLDETRLKSLRDRQRHYSSLAE